jgi:GH15 family glucan-1,4-alpha-glucosidase
MAASTLCVGESISYTPDTASSEILRCKTQSSLTPIRPEFDSPSIFCRLLDKDKGGYFSIHPAAHLSCTTKQQYLPSSNILQTRYIHEDGVVDLVDFFPRPKNASVLFKGPKQSAYREVTSVQEELKQWLVRRVECIRGRLQLGQLHVNQLWI